VLNLVPSLSVIVNIYHHPHFLCSDLSGNQLTGLLPANLSDGVASYRTLQTMNMSHNSFSGPMAPDFLMYLQNLVSA
jgi:hypothetical protein